MHVSKVYPGNPVGIMHAWCLMGQVLGFTPLHLPPSMTPRSTRWRQCICHTGKSWICLRVAGHCQHSRKRIYMYLSVPGFEVLKVWSFRFLENDHASSVLRCFWHMWSCCTVCQQFYSEKFSGCLGCVPILKMQSLHMWSKAIPSIVVHRCTFTVTLASASDLICVFLVCTNTQFVFAYYEETHSMYLHSMNTQCICILSAHAAPYRGIWHQHHVCSSLAKTSQNNEKPWQLWRRGERGCTYTVQQSWWRPWTSFGNCRSPWFPAVSWQKQKSISPGTLDIRGIYVSWIDPILLSIAQDTQLLWEQSFIEHLEITYCAPLPYGRLYK